jgi:endonuclease VIII-like 1
MPELSEVKIMGDFINYIVDNETFFQKIEKSEVSKVKTELDPFDGAVFTMSSESRGKELMLNLEMVGGDIDGAVTKKLLVNLGMSGNWVYVKRDSKNLEKVLKHSHLRFITARGNYLVLHDIRRFAKWRWVDDWSANRGPCPLTEYGDFVDHVKLNWQKSKAFNQPLNEVLMNQNYFNGVGNYIRSEVLYRADINPFQLAATLEHKELDNLLTVIHLCFRDSYTLGGGQLKDWQNPYGTEGNDFNQWMKCYGNKEMMKVKDRTGRTFWFNPKWESFIPESYSRD